MNLSTLANIATALTVLTGVVFGLVEAQRARHARQERAAFGTVRLAWRKLRPYVEAERIRSGSRKTFERFQWLAEQLERHSPVKTSLTLGAYEAYPDWEP